MRVSVVLPVYDGERFLPEALASLHAQTRQADQIVAIDDGSKDRSAEILARDSGIELIRQAHAGVAQARNAGVARATGELICFLDQDDVWHPERLARAAAAFERDPRLGIVVCAQVNFLTAGMTQVPAWMDPGLLGVTRHVYGANALMARRDELLRIGRFDPELVPVDDSDWFVRAFDGGVGCLYLDEPLVRRRVHDRNLSGMGRGRKLMAQILHRSLRRRSPGAAHDEGRVDVVIPAFNAAEYLPEAIASVLAQGPCVHRVIVVDDGSSDASAEVAQSFGPRVEVLRQSHGGAGCARNAGIARCEAAYLAFLDADDRWLPNKLAVQLSALVADSRLDFVLCRMRAFASPELPADECRALAAQHAQVVDAWVAGALLIRRSAFDRVGPLATDLVVGEMIDWFDRARLAQLSSTLLPEVLLERRLHRGNTTRLATARRGYLRLAKRHLERTRGAASADGKP